MPLQPYEVFDASTEALQAELRELEANAVNATSLEAPGLLRLRTLIKQELEERGGAEELFDGLQELEDFLGSASSFIDKLDAEDVPPSPLQSAPAPVPVPAPAPAPARPLVSSQAYMDGNITKRRAHEQAPAGQPSASSTSPTHTPAAGGSTVGNIAAPAGAQCGAEGADAGGGAGESEREGGLGAVDGGGENDAEREGGTGGGSAAGGAAAAAEEPPLPKKKLTPREAAMLAFREERRKVAKARQARETEGWAKGAAKPKDRRHVKISKPGHLPWKRARRDAEAGAETAPPARIAGATAEGGAQLPRPVAGPRQKTKPAVPRLSAGVRSHAGSDTAGAPAGKGGQAAVARSSQPLADIGGGLPRVADSSDINAGDASAASSVSAVMGGSIGAELPQGAHPVATQERDSSRDKGAADSCRDQLIARPDGLKNSDMQAGGDAVPCVVASAASQPDRAAQERITGGGADSDADATSSEGRPTATAPLSEGSGLSQSSEPALPGGAPADTTDAASSTTEETTESEASSYVDPSDDDYVDDFEDDIAAGDYADDFDDDVPSESDSVDGFDGGAIGYVTNLDHAAGGPTRLVVRPDSADSADGRRGGLVAALADFGLGGDANGGLCAWGDADKTDLLSWGDGGGGWDEYDTPRKAPLPPPVAPALGYDSKPGAPMVGPLSKIAPSLQPVPATQAHGRGDSARVGSGDSPAHSARAGSAKPPTGRPAAEAADAGLPSYHYTYASFAEVFTEFSAGKETAARAEREAAAGALLSMAPGAAGARPVSATRPGSARHEVSAVHDRMQKTVQRCCRWLEHHRELWPTEEPAQGRIAASNPNHHITRWFRVACSAGHPEVYNVVSSAMELSGGWDEDIVDGPAGASDRAPIPGGPIAKCFMWNLMWTWSCKVPVPYSDLMIWQKVNHFPDARQLTRKDLLKRHLSRHHKMLKGTRAAAIFNIMPPTFTLPKEYSSWVEAFGKGVVEAPEEGGNLWIMKPVGSSRGRGISLVSAVDDIVHGEQVVMQKYIARPLLIDGYKFDLRLYVLVTSFNPLEAWLYQEGFARFATSKYTTDPASVDDLFVHLTNSSIQKQREDGGGELPARLVGGSGTGQPFGGSKCSLTRLWELLQDDGIDRGRIWARITEVVLAALFAVQSSIPHNNNSFELYGFDVIISRSQKVWLIEANSSPSLGCDTPLDQEIKPVMVRDIISVVEPPEIDRVALAEVLQRRLTRKGRARNERRLMAGTDQEERQRLNQDLSAVLRGRMPREYGAMPRDMGRFERIAPSRPYEEIQRMKATAGGRS